MGIEVWPVIHVLDTQQSLRCADIAVEAGCPGVMLISMDGNDAIIDPIAFAVLRAHPDLKLGVNYLTMRPTDALIRSQANNYDATWSDVQMFDNGLMTDDDARLVMSVIRPGHEFFAAAAFKGQRDDPSPADTAALVANAGLIPTTSGPKTGVPPTAEKIALMRHRLQIEDPLAIASGITPENVGMFAPHLTHILVSTGISSSFHEFDPDRLARLMGQIPL